MHGSRLVMPLVGALIALGGMAWATDFVTLQGEYTVYTAECTNGDWQGLRCNGRMQAGARYRFRALPKRHEVVFWTLGADEPSGKYTDCSIQDGRNWSCPSNADAGRTITRALSMGLPARDPASPTRAFHRVTKTQWWLLRWGWPMSRNAAQ